MNGATTIERPEFDSNAHSHRRFNPLTQTYILCSPHRTLRPWLGQQEKVVNSRGVEYDSACYLCPNNRRAGGELTPVYEQSYVFENDFAALADESVNTPERRQDQDSALESLFKVEPTRGKCYVICFSPKHNLSVAEMSDVEIGTIVDVWTKLYKEISKDNPWIKYIQIFENKGSIMGCSNPHPHGQTWSMSYIPSTPSTILKSMKTFALTQALTPGAPTLSNGLACLLLSYAHAELKSHTAYLANPSGGIDSRVIYLGSHWVALVPFWASWPFETIVIPFKRQISSLAALTTDERDDLAHTIGAVSRRMDNLFECSFGYTMGLYQAPVDIASRPAGSPPADDEDWTEYAQLHVGFYPPLLRSSTVKKFLVGFELFAEIQRDITPEQAAVRLRECSDVHYKKTVPSSTRPPSPE